MNKETFELRQEWAKSNIINLNKEKNKYDDEIRTCKMLLEHVNEDIKRYEKVLKEKYER